MRHSSKHSSQVGRASTGRFEGHSVRPAVCATQSACPRGSRHYADAHGPSHGSAKPQSATSACHHADLNARENRLVYRSFDASGGQRDAFTIEKHLPAWDLDPTQESALVTSRRAFHTLKGSGRVVGASELAEFAWSIENLLNRLLDRTLVRTPQVLASLREAVAVLPQLVRRLEDRTPPKADVAGIVARAHALAAGKAPEPAGTGK